MGFDTYILKVDREKIKCIGVGGVVVVPKYQGQRLPQLMFEKLNEWRNKKDSTIPVVLFCPESLVNYYKKHNFNKVDNDVYYLQKGDYQKSKFELMSDIAIRTNGSIYIPSNPW
ncbi:MAG: hypothetical protein BalsKO_06720 [Balneolaceae bacterium]